MSERPDLGFDLTAQENAVGEQLAADRPVPGAGFRGALGRLLLADDPRYVRRPPRLRLISAGCLAASLVLLACGALQATGAI